jgi:hypothetical protein
VIQNCPSENPCLSRSKHTVKEGAAVENTVSNYPRDRIVPLPVVAGQSNHLGRDPAVASVHRRSRSLTTILAGGSGAAAFRDPRDPRTAAFPFGLFPTREQRPTHASTHVEIELVVSQSATC